MLHNINCSPAEESVPPALQKRVSYKKITSYPWDDYVRGCKDAEGRGRRQDGRDMRCDLGMNRGRID